MRELREMLREFDTAMLTTVTNEGLLRARPMAIQDPEDLGDCDLWFVTPIDSPKAEEILHRRQVGVTCYRQRDRAYVSISALASLRRDREEIRRLFKPDWKLWFPDGADDPSIAVLALDVERAEYWSPRGGRLGALYDMVKSLARGQSADANFEPPKRV